MTTVTVPGETPRLSGLRVLRENAREHHRSAYLPFGGGRRVCAGRSFAVVAA
jgi:cytochrome P450